MSATNNNTDDGGFRRIVFYDPTQPEEQIDNMPVTPEYSEMCISFSLVVEVVNRFNSNTQKSENLKYVIVWNSYKNESGEFEARDNYISFLQGDDVMGTPYLSTFYTDTTYDDMVRDHGRVVEGLGVENVTVAFENYYVPTVNIKFVDQRGSALFGREELHHDNDEITADTVFGCFFTQPYPKFKLQVKGFFGKPVTYQLVCSNFRGNLNPSTGNFEANVSFIGYQYGLLTDVPFNYLVAAPYCDYVGKSYWDQHKNDDAWRFSDTSGKSVIKLYEMFSRIKKALGNEKLVQYLTSDETTETANALIESANTVVSVVAAFVQTFVEVLMRSGWYESREPESWQVLVTFPRIDDGDTITIDVSADSLRESFDAVKMAISNHNDTFPQNKISVQENSFFAMTELPGTLTATRFFVPPKETVEDNASVSSSNADFKWSYAKSKDEPQSGALVGMSVQDGGPKIGAGMDKRIYEDVHGVGANVGEFAYLLDFGDIIKQVDDLTTLARQTEEQSKRDIEEAFLVVANKELGFIPYIGNIFRILMAHLETFTHMMFHLNDVIVSNRSTRTRAMLGLVGKTDTPSQMMEYVSPWPMIYKKNNNSNRFSTGEDDSDVLGWVGDINHRFEEEKLVRALYAASYKQAQGGLGENGKPKELNYIPVMGLDLLLERSPFATIGEIKPDNISGIGGIVGMRVAQLMGIGDPSSFEVKELVRSIGKADAYNFYLRIDGRDSLRDIYTAITKNGGADTLIGVATCSEEGKKFEVGTDGSDNGFHVFETAKCTVGSEGRHPIFASNGDELDYVHFVAENNICMVPLPIPNFKNNGRVNANVYPNYYQKQGGDCLFNVKPIGTSDTLYTSSFSAFRDSAVEGGVDPSYIGYSMVKFITDQATVDGIINRYNELRNKDVGFSIGLETFSDDFSQILDRYWGKDFQTISDDIIWLQGKNAEWCISQPYSNYGEKLTKMLWSGKNSVPNVSVLAEDGKEYGNILSTKAYRNILWGEEKKYARYSDGEYTINGSVCEANSLVFANISFFYKDYCYTLFSTLFYAAQESREAKAYLFLMSLPYGPYEKEMFKQGHSFTMVVPYGFLLRMGAHFWRKHKMRNGNADPIRTVGKGFEAKPAGNGDYILYNVSEKLCWGGFLAPDDSKNSYYKFDFVKFDPQIEDELVNVFEEFVKGPLWTTISDKTSVKGAEGLFNLINGTYLPIITNGKSSYINKGEWVDALKSDDNRDLSEQLKNDVISQIPHFGTTYKTISAPADTANVFGFTMLISDDEEIQVPLRKIFFGKSIICQAGSVLCENHGRVSVYRSQFEGYVGGFLETIQKIIGTPVSQNQVTAEEMEEFDENGVQYTRSVLVSMYRYLKNLWDKWLVQENDDAYNVSKFFDQNFIFMDTVYRDIKSRFMTNCQILIDTYEDVRSTEDVTLFKFIGDIVTRHHCMFLAVPDFITLGRDNNEVLKVLRETFSPCPYNSMPPERKHNYFVCIYTPGLSSTPSSGEFSGFRDETLNIWSRNGVNPNTPKHFKMSNFIGGGDDGDGGQHDEMDRYGYNVPAFGVAFGQQHNHLFKNVRLSMETPVITSAVINTLSHVAMKGSGNDHAIAFIGQDIYPVFSNYSYTAEVEMMGNAQIQPLMYFQLMNVPMWRGTYMIFNVSHSMSPGQMTTTFKGMKLGNTNVDYSSAWFTKRVNYDKAVDPDADLCRQCPGFDDSSSAIGSECLDEHGVVKDACIKNSQMRKVFGFGSKEGVDFFWDYKTNVWCVVSYINYVQGPAHRDGKTGLCASSIEGWYGRAGVVIGTYWVTDGGHRTATYEIMCKQMAKFGFVERLHCTPSDANSGKINNRLRPGDVAIMFGYNSNGPTSHTCMWVGNHWRSDYYQGGKAYPYGDRVRGPVDVAFSVWYRPDFQENAIPSNTPQAQSASDEAQKNKAGYKAIVFKLYSNTNPKDNYKLRVVDKEGTTIKEYPICVGKNKGNKQHKDDMRTPESAYDSVNRAYKPLQISSIEDSSNWTHDFNDGQGEIKAYGQWFHRLSGYKGGTGIGIHGIGVYNMPNIYGVPNPKDGSIGTGRGSNGCIRMLNEDIIDFHDRFAYKGMPVVIYPDK